MRDREIAMLLLSARPVSCKRGCDFCCYEPIYAERGEAELIADCVLKMPQADRDHAVASLRRWIDTAKSNGALLEQPLAVKWRGLNLPCPLLRNHECMVYLDRPDGCRTFLVTEGREACADVRLRDQQRFIAYSNFKKDAFWKIVGDRNIVVDHLGFLLSEFLLGETLKSFCFCELNRKRVVVSGRVPEA